MPLTGQVNTARLKDRVVNILKDPKKEWTVIEAESTDVQKLYREYIAILAAIPAVCSFIGMTVIGLTVPLVGTIRTPVVNGFAQMIVSYVLTLVAAYAAAVIVNALAPTFESRPNTIQALKLVAYAATPTYLAGVFNLIPALSVLGILAALYAIYLFYLGLPVLMKTPESKVVPYMAVSAVIVIIMFVLVGIVSAALTGVSGAAIF